MISGPKKVLLMDEISSGLDSTTIFQIVKCIRNFVHHIEGTVLMALVQPAPETFELFDDLMLLSEGHLVYHGPRADVLQFFESIGFRLPRRKAVADFLQEVHLYPIDIRSNLYIKFVLCLFIVIIFLEFACVSRLRLGTIKSNIGQTSSNLMNSFLLNKLRKHLEIPDLGRRLATLYLIHMTNQEVIL